MKIIKNGKVMQQKVYFTDTCRYCGCVFEFTTADIEEREKSPEGHISYHCPYCKIGIQKAINELEHKIVEEEWFPKDIQKQDG